MLQMLSDLADKLGKTPSKVECKSHLGMDGATYAHHFGSYSRAIELAGLVPNKPLPPSFDDFRKRVGFKLRFKILERDGFRCTYCGGAPDDGYVLHVDHIIPISRGGNTEYDNLITACFVCNEGKSDEVLSEDSSMVERA